MSPAVSFFLDALRVLAAFVVFWDHGVGLWYPQWKEMAGKLGHYAVIIFFVLSGYVIAYTATKRKGSLKDYAIARLSRLYSVVIPALVLTASIALYARAFDSQLFQQIAQSHEFIRYFLVAIFCTDLWFAGASPRANPPFWSLSYEFWYYVIFGCGFYLRGKTRALLLILALLISGVKILLLLPIWLLGAGAMLTWNRLFRCEARKAQVVFFLLILLGVAFAIWMPMFPQKAGTLPLALSSSSVTDFIFGVIVSASILTFGSAWNTPPTFIVSSVKWAADHTFSLYLYHYPLMLFFDSMFPTARSSVWVAAGASLMVLLVVGILSTITESKRNIWRNIIARGFDFVFGRGGLHALERTP